MKIIKAEHQTELGGGTASHDVYFDNGFAVRIIEGNAYLFKVAPGTTLNDLADLDPVQEIEEVEA